MEIGRVKWFNHNKGYGFVTAEDKSDVFVHITDINSDGFITLKTDQKVQFEIVNGIKGLQAVNVELVLESSEASQTKNLLSLISNEWKLEAKQEKIDFFYYVSQIAELKDGKNSYVIGRKGMGKTAISEYLLSQSEHNIFCEKLSFKNYPFNFLYSLDDSKYTAPNQYISIWKYLIYSSVCKAMS